MKSAKEEPVVYFIGNEWSEDFVLCPNMEQVLSVTEENGMDNPDVYEAKLIGSVRTKPIFEPKNG